MSRQPIIDRIKLSRRSSLALLAVLALGTGLAQENVEREGYFEVRSASTRPVDGVHTLDARLQLILSSEALAALESGVTLTIELQMQIIRSRRMLINRLISVRLDLRVIVKLRFYFSNGWLLRAIV